MEDHPIAGIFPLLQTDELDALAQDIAENGLHEPIWLYEDKILDGRNRYRACGIAGVEARTKQYMGNDPVGFVVSLNLHRRHLNESQRGMVAANIARLEKGDNQHTQICAPTQEAAAELLNVSKRTLQTAKKVQQGTPELQEAVTSGRVSVSAAADVAELPEQEQREVVARGEKEILQKAKEIRAQKAEVKKAERVEKIKTISQGNAELDTSKTYPVIYADPPWRYDYSPTDTRKIENQYPTMSMDEIKSMPVADIACKDSILFLWATSPKLAEAMELVEAWGFTYRSCAVWDKERIGMGYYFRQQHELLLVATRGDIPAPDPANRPASVIREKRGEHSSKPVSVARMIEQMYPDFPRMELFCRDPQEGWDVFGNQACA